MSRASGGSRRMSLLDKMEHIAELEGLVDSDEDEDLDDSVMDAESSDMVPRMSGTLSPALEAEDEDLDDGDDEEEDDDDEVLYTATDLGYEWQGGADDEEDLGYGDLGYEDTGSASMVEDLEGVDTMLASAAAMRRISGLRASRTGNSYSSAPEGTSSGDEDLFVEGGAQRRSTFAGPPGGLIREGGMSRRVSSRRQNINLGSMAAPPGMNSLNMSTISDSTPVTSGGGAQEGHGSGSVFQKIQSNVRRATAMKSRRNTAAVGGDLNSIQQAASKLESGPDSVFAAASVVAHSAATAAKRGHVQFNTDDAVLCMLTLLNVTNPGDDTESFTVSPVNIHGYSPGEGKTEAERQGPYVFVLAIVKFVHFDEDERYYTVARADNGTEQRADAGRTFSFPFCCTAWAEQHLFC